MARREHRHFEYVKRRPSSPRRSQVVWRWSLLLGYMVGIFILSAVPGTSLPDIQVSDKLIHGGEFGVLGVLTYRALGQHAITWPRICIAILSILAVIFYGAADEFHQLFVPQRAAELADLGADSLGATVAVLAWLKATARWKWLQ